MGPSVVMTVMLVAEGGGTAKERPISTYMVSVMNLSQKTHRILVDGNIQEPEPELTTLSGLKVPLQDSRMVSKFDRTPYEELFVKLQPYEKSENVPAGIYRNDDGTFSFRFGSFQSGELKDTCYNLKFTFKSGISEWRKGSGRIEKVPDVWIGGAVSSNYKICRPV